MQKSVEKVLETTGMAELTSESPLEAVEFAAQQLAVTIAEAEPVRQAILRSEGAAILKRIGIRSPVALIDAAESVVRSEEASTDLAPCTFGDGIVEIVETQEGTAFLAIGPEGPVVAPAWNGKQPWPTHRLPWLTVPEAEQILAILPLQSAPPLEEHARLIMERVELPEPQSTWALLLAAWAAGTYLVDRFRHFPLIALEGPAARGKTRLARALVFPAYRGFISPSLTPATLIRDRAWHRATLVLDVEDLPRMLQRGDHMKDLVLHSFQQDGIVRRVARPDAPPAEQIATYSAYGPTVLISNVPIPTGSPLETRCIPVRMPEAGDVAKAEALQPAEALELRARLTAWAARFFASGERLPEIDPPFGSRVRDMARPILSIVKRWAPYAYDDIVALFRDLVEERREQTAATPESRVAVGLWELRNKVNGGRIYVGDLEKHINRGLGKSDPMRLNRQHIGIVRRTLNLRGGRGGSNGRAYVSWPGEAEARALFDRYRPPAA